MGTAKRPAEFMRVEAVIVVVSSTLLSPPCDEEVLVVISQPPRPESMGWICVTGELKAQMPPASSKDPSRYCIRLWESMIPVLELSSTPASALTSGSRLLASSLLRKRVGTPMLCAKSWTFCSASIWSASWATIHLPVLRCGMPCLAQRSYSISFPRRQSFVFRESGP